VYTARHLLPETSPNEPDPDGGYGQGERAPVFDKRVLARVEAVCEKGCRSVREDIATLRRGESIPESAGLTRGERGQLLNELEQIMAVYGDTCRIG
jgi:hypothetical protein